MEKKVALASLLGSEHLTESRKNVYNDTEPLGLLYIGGVAKYYDHDVRIFHPYQKANPSEKLILEEISRFQPDILGMSSMTNTFNRSVKLAEEVKKNSPKTLIIFGGDHIGTNPSDVKSYPVIDIGVYGEGEETFKEILENKPLEEIQGISYINEEGELQINSPRKRVFDRTNIPLPLRDPEILKASKIGALMYPSVSEQTGAGSFLFQFGCPLRCSYCSATTLYGGELTMSSSEFLVNEMRNMREQFNMNTAFITDLTFNLKPWYSEEFCKKLSEAKLGLSWYALVRPTSPSNQPLLRNSTLEAMVKAGATKIGFGIESFEESAMKDYHRPTSLEEDERVLRKIDELEALSKVFLILGHPNETKEYYNKVIKTLKQLKPDEVRISYLTPFPGTPLWEELNSKNQKLITSTNYDDYTTFKPIMKMKNFSSDEVEDQRLRILREYYNSKEYKDHFRTKILRTPRYEQSFTEFHELLTSRDIL